MNKMDFLVVKTIFCIILMVLALMTALTTSDIIDGHLYASLGVISGTFVSKFISTQTQVKNEKY